MEMTIAKHQTGAAARAALSGSGRAVTVWLFTVCALVALMVVVGGYVRLTRSGLSIVEWNVISGILPPLSEEAWNLEFAKYQQTPEFRIVNATMTLPEYKRIFFLEYFHRLVARIAGLIVVAPLAVFLLRGRIRWRDSGVYLAIAVLFGLQGALGWYMVASGLVDRPHVSHFRLTVHLLAALALLGITLWAALDRVYGRAAPQRRAGNRALRILAVAVLGVLVLQIAYGALVAGLKAGHVSRTWPLMSGSLVPGGMFVEATPWWQSLLEAPVTVHFMHRWLAFAVLAAGCILYHRAGREAGVPGVRSAALVLVALLVVQILLGISVVLFGVPLWLALLHQATALALFAAAVFLNHRLAHGC